MVPLAPLLVAALLLQFTLPSAEAIRTAPTFAPGERVVATHYFYWYRFSDSHFDALSLHFLDERAVSFESEAWHLREMRDVRAAGIDVVLPVYWGAVDHYEKPDVAFSVKGLPPLVAALDAMAGAGETPPRVGLFYDTTTLLNDVRGAAPAGGRADLRTEAGRDVFYRTIRDFFRMIPERHWARIGGRPLVVLYSAAFAAGHDQRTFDELAARFARDFDGLRPFVVRDVSWANAGTEASTAWGAALNGPEIHDGAAQIGPGYDDSPVPGRTTPIRDREDGRFYEQSWRAALASGRDLVLVETWNEHHEGTSIAETREFGRRYIEITARYAALFKSRATVADDIVLAHPEPRPRPDLSWGAEAKGASVASYVAGTPATGGLRPVDNEDGRFEIVAAPDETPAIASTSAGPAYLYFQVSDWFALDVRADFDLEIDFLDAGRGALLVEYDSWNAGATLRGAYTVAGRIERRGTAAWRTERLTLAGARLANRQNAGADFRLSVAGGGERAIVRGIRIRRRARRRSGVFK